MTPEAVDLRTVADHIRRNPAKYRNFGRWWWSMKVLLRPHYDFGAQDDPEMRAVTDAEGKGDPGRIARLGMREYVSRAGGYQDGRIDLPDGSRYYLTDPDVLESSAL